MACILFHRLIQPDHPHISQQVCFFGIVASCSSLVGIQLNFLDELLSSLIFPMQVAASLEKNLIPNLSSSPPDIEALRLYLTLPQCPLFSNPNNYITLAIPFAKAVTNLKDAPHKVLGKCLEFLRQ